MTRSRLGDARSVRLGATGLLLAAAAWLAPCAARADDLQEARRRFGLGEELYARGSFEEAYTWYEAAYEAAPLSDFLFNMGQCQRKLGNAREALGLYRRFLDSNPPEDKRAIVVELVREIEATLPPGEGHDGGSGSGSGDAAESPTGGSGDAAESPTGGSDGSAVARIRARTWIVAGGAVILAGAGGLLALRAQSAQDELDSLDCTRVLDRCQDVRREGQAYFLARNVTLAAGGAALAVALVLAIVDVGASTSGSEVAIVPTVSPGRAALTAIGRF